MHKPNLLTGSRHSRRNKVREAFAAGSDTVTVAVITYRLSPDSGGNAIVAHGSDGSVANIETRRFSTSKVVS